MEEKDFLKDITFNNLLESISSKTATEDDIKNLQVYALIDSLRPENVVQLLAVSTKDGIVRPENKGFKLFVTNTGLVIRVSTNVRSGDKYPHLVKWTWRKLKYDRREIYVNAIPGTNAIKLSRLVAQAFHPDTYAEDLECHHIDLNPLNNCADNIVMMSKVDHLALHKQLREESKR